MHQAGHRGNTATVQHLRSTAGRMLPEWLGTKQHHAQPARCAAVGHLTRHWVVACACQLGFLYTAAQAALIRTSMAAAQLQPSPHLFQLVLCFIHTLHVLKPRV